MRGVGPVLVGMVLCSSPALILAQDGYFSSWFVRVAKTKDEQPH